MNYCSLFLVPFLFISLFLYSYSIKNNNYIEGEFKNKNPLNKIQNVENIGYEIYKTKDIIRFKIFDKTFKDKNWEVPNYIPKELNDKFKNLKNNYFNQQQEQEQEEQEQEPNVEIEIKKTGFFGIKISRKDSKEVIFDSIFPETDLNNQIYFKDQYIQISNKLSTNSKIFGFGERTTSFLLKKNQNFTIFNKNHHYTFKGMNLYGSHPFFLRIDPFNNASSYGVFLLNSNAMEIEYSNDNILKYKIIGGILDFFIFLGPTPESVINQQQQLIGKPYFPPYYAFGFHQCRYGYKNIDMLKNVVSKYQKSKIPLESIWSDIEYMDNYKTFTYSKDNFSDLPQFIDKLHKNHQKYLCIIDPGIKVSDENNNNNYLPYKEGLEMDIFIKESKSLQSYLNHSKPEPMIGRMFCGKSYFPDFAEQNISIYWEKQFKDLYSKIKFDGVWLDQNELTSFCDGFCDQFYEKPIPNYLKKNRFDYPPFMPGGKHSNLNSLTMTLSARISINKKEYNTTHYNYHNIYPLEEGKTTRKALDNVLKKRSLVVSRSSFTGIGKYVDHWLGDNQSLFKDIKDSMSAIMTFQLFGINFLGADVCGFHGNATEELCIRWTQFASFGYPFMRNHNHKSNSDQEFYVFGKEMINVAKDMIHHRYTLFPLFYTLFWENSYFGGTAINSLIFQFPKDLKVYNIDDDQIMVGNKLMISPILTKDTFERKVYYPLNNRWFDFFNLREVNQQNIGTFSTVKVQKNEINVNIRGGTVLLKQDHFEGETLYQTKKNNLTLILAPDYQGKAEGSYYLDDGENLEKEKKGLYIKYKLKFKNDHLAYISDYYQFNLENEIIFDNLNKNKNEKSIYIHKIKILGNKKDYKIYSININGTSFKGGLDGIKGFDIERLNTKLTVITIKNIYNLKITDKFNLEVVMVKSKNWIYYLVLGFAGIFVLLICAFVMSLFLISFCVFLWKKLKNKQGDKIPIDEVQEDDEEDDEDNLGYNSSTIGYNPSDYMKQN